MHRKRKREREKGRKNVRKNEKNLNFFRMRAREKRCRAMEGVWFCLQVESLRKNLVESNTELEGLRHAKQELEKYAVGYLQNFCQRCG